MNLNDVAYLFDAVILAEVKLRLLRLLRLLKVPPALPQS